RFLLSISTLTPAPPPVIPTPSLHDALPISHLREHLGEHLTGIADDGDLDIAVLPDLGRIDIGVDDLRVRGERIEPAGDAVVEAGDRKSTRLNSSHVSISYAVFCLKKKTKDS